MAERTRPRRALALAVTAVACARLAGGCPRDEDPVDRLADRPAPERVKEHVEPDLPPVDPLAPVDRSRLRTPWARVAVGDWAEYRIPTGTLRVEVVELKPHAVVVRRADRLEEILLGPEEREYVRRKDPGVLNPEQFGLEPASLEIAGHELYCMIVRPRGRSGEETWYAPDDIGIDDGVVLRREGGVVVLELVGWGSGAGGGAPREH